MVMRRAITALFLVFALSSAQADAVQLAPDHPERYVVVKGDTLWDISGRFLSEPWRWPEVWEINPQIENPHLIYPGDTVSLVYREGQPVLMLERGLPTVKLTPQVRVEQLERAIPTLPMDAIQQFLLRAQVVDPKQMENAGYVMAMEEGHLVAGTNNKMYARGLGLATTTRYRVFRQGKAYQNPGAGKKDVLGYEAIQIGDARVEAFGDPATLMLTTAYREALVGDRLLAVPEDEEVSYNFTPRAPEQEIEGLIISVFDAVSRVGQYQMVVLNRGHLDGIQSGHVLAAYTAGDQVRDPVSRKGEWVELPDTRSGLIMVFRTFEQVSYALVMKATREIRLYDAVRNP